MSSNEPSNEQYFVRYLFGSHQQYSQSLIISWSKIYFNPIELDYKIFSILAGRLAGLKLILFIRIIGRH